MNPGRLWTVIALDLTQRIRSIAWYVLLGVFALVLLIVTLLTLAASRFQEESGPVVYSVIVFVVLLLVVLVSPTLAGNAINGDRDAATLAPVQVTLATTAEIVLGKFLAAWITGLAFAVVAVPFLVIALVSGGVSPVVALVSLAVLVVEIGVVAAIGVGLSGIFARPLFSVATTYLVVMALVVGTGIAFALSGLAVRTEVTYHTRDVIFDGDDKAQGCGDWNEYTVERPRFDTVWWMLAPNPFVILADATPATFDENGNARDAFSGLKAGVRQAQVSPPTDVRYDGCGLTSEFQPTPEHVVATTTPSWAVGLGIQILLAGGILLWGASRTRTPARRLPRGTRIA